MDQLIEEWCACVQFAWTLARGERLGELRGKRAKLMDERGLHPYSLLCGQIEMLQHLLPELREFGFDPVLLRAEARKEADEWFRVEIMEEFYAGRRDGYEGRADAANDGRRGKKPDRRVASR